MKQWNSDYKNPRTIRRIVDKYPELSKNASDKISVGNMSVKGKWIYWDSEGWKDFNDTHNQNIENNFLRRRNQVNWSFGNNVSKYGVIMGQVNFSWTSSILE